MPQAHQTLSAPSTGSAAADAGRHDSGGQIVQFWSGSDIAGLVKSPELTQALERWRKMVASKLPRLNEFLGPNPAPALNNAILMVRIPGDLLFTHHGPGAHKMIGTNFTGLRHTELKSPVSHDIRKAYLQAAETGQPYYLRFVSPFSQQHFCLEQLVLPLATDEHREVGFILVYTAPMDDQLEVLKAVFDRSPIGMVAAVAHPDDSGKLTNGRVLLINARARQVLRLPAESNDIVWLRDLGAWFREGALWTKTNMTMESGQTHVHYRDQSNNKSYRVTIEPFDRFVLFSIIEIAVVTH